MYMEELRTIRTVAIWAAATFFSLVVLTIVVGAAIEGTAGSIDDPRFLEESSWNGR